jgi:NAD(P)-dependent dehydrogenase (short-subunit alcohol dehydrogenase family)
LLTTLPQSKTQIAWWTKLARQTERQFAIQGNVAKKGEVERLFTQAEKAFGKIDILVNNASVYEFVSLEEVSERQFHSRFDTNVLGMLLVTQEALKHFNGDGGGTINIGSLASSLTPPTARWSTTRRKPLSMRLREHSGRSLARARSALTLLIPGRDRRTGRRKTPAAGPTERPACNSSQFSDTTTDVLSAAPVCKNLYKSDLNFNHPFNTEQNYRI